MTDQGNGRTIKIPVRKASRQLPPMEEQTNLLLAAPHAFPEHVAEAVAEVETDATGWQSAAEVVRERVERRAEVRLNEERRRLLSLMLTVADNLERALAHAGETDSLRAGVQLTLDDLLRQLAREGVEPVQALGQLFDPTLHEAVATDGSGGDRVVKVLQTGYTLNGELLRPARVVVGGSWF